MEIITTVFDALLMFCIAFSGVDAKSKGTFRVAMLMIVILIMNLFCIWGNL